MIFKIYMITMINSEIPIYFHHEKENLVNPVNPVKIVVQDKKSKQSQQSNKS